MNFGKFNSAEELLKGYNELEKSFTQKCQQLSALKSQVHQQTAAQAEQSESPQAAASFADESQSQLSAQNSSSIDPQAQASCGSAAETVQGPVPVQSAYISQTDGTNAAASPSGAERSTTVGSADTVPQSAATPVLVGPDSAPNVPTEAQLQQYLLANPAFARQLLQSASANRRETATAPVVMYGGGNVSPAAPSRPKTLREASILAKQMFDS